MIPAGQSLLIRMIDGVDSKTNNVGDIFHASLETDLNVNGTLVARKGTDVYGRLAPGVTRVTAQQEMNALVQRLVQQYPNDHRGPNEVVLDPMWRSPFGGNVYFATVLPILLAIAILVLLLACANVANLLLVRAIARRREIAIRLALGGSRWKIVRQLLSEGFVLALLGGVGGLTLGLWSSDLLIGSMRKFMPFEIVWSTGANPAILAATFGFCLLGTLMFALGPALKISRNAVITFPKSFTIVAPVSSIAVLAAASISFSSS